MLALVSSKPSLSTLDFSPVPGPGIGYTVDFRFPSRCNLMAKVWCGEKKSYCIVNDGNFFICCSVCI